MIYKILLTLSIIYIIKLVAFFQIEEWECGIGTFMMNKSTNHELWAVDTVIYA